MDSDKNQRNKRTKVTDLRQKSGKKQEESPSGPPESQSRTQSPRAFWPAGERPDRLWDNRLHFPRKRGFRSYDVWLSLNGSRKEKTVNSRNGGLKVFEKQEF